MTEPSDRRHEHVLEIAASPEVVWKAITEARELVRWFPLGAETRPGPGGEILYRWGTLEGRCRILSWDPPRHLRTGWMEAPGGADPSSRAPLCVDWFLEADGGATRLRLVHSGFGRDASWDQEFDGTNRGWHFELRALKHYLEHQRGKDRRAAWIRRPVSATPEAVWARFARPGALFRRTDLETLAPGDRFRMERADGDLLEGRVLVLRAPHEFGAVLESHGDAMLRFGYEDCMGQPEAHVWLASWELSAQRFAAEEAAWRGLLDQAFAPLAGASRVVEPSR